MTESTITGFCTLISYSRRDEEWNALPKRILGYKGRITISLHIGIEPTCPREEAQLADAAECDLVYSLDFTEMLLFVL